MARCSATSAAPPPSAPPAPPAWLRQAAAPHWTVLFFILTAVGSLAIIEEWGSATLLMTLPFSLLALNLGAAVATLPRFRRDLPLLLFHLCLLALIALFTWSRLTYLDATTAITQGETFDGFLIAEERGPLHNGDVRNLRFRNDGFTEEYPNRYRITKNRVRWREGNGPWQTTIVGGNRPLVLGQYRIYTKRHRGFTGRFRWQGHDGQMELGRVQFNTSEAMAPASSWTVPGGPAIWAMLELTETEATSPRSQSPIQDLNAAGRDYRLVVRTADDQRYIAKRGEPLQLPTGTLYLDKLEAWMGYRILYDPARPWILATVVAGVVSLLWFYGRQLQSRNGWDSDR